MALDYQSLAATVADYANTSSATGVHLLKLALLKTIATSLNPAMATDAQSLLSQTDIPGYANSSCASTADLLELALLNIIANSLGGGGGAVGGVVIGNYGGAQPTPSPLPAINTVYVDTSGGQLWAYNATTNTWTELIA